jgi:hypothetical protein
VEQRSWLDKNHITFHDWPGFAAASPLNDWGISPTSYYCLGKVVVSETIAAMTISHCDHHKAKTANIACRTATHSLPTQSINPQKPSPGIAWSKLEVQFRVNMLCWPFSRTGAKTLHSLFSTPLLFSLSSTLHFPIFCQLHFHFILPCR